LAFVFLKVFFKRALKTCYKRISTDHVSADPVMGRAKKSVQRTVLLGRLNKSNKKSRWLLFFASLFLSADPVMGRAKKSVQRTVLLGRLNKPNKKSRWLLFFCKSFSSVLERLAIKNKTPQSGVLFVGFVCRGGRIRTYDLLLPKQARYRATLHPEKLKLKGRN
jgi:hypothetical protein